jgi:diketogulonate reductase-like aldo/keto reductase
VPQVVFAFAIAVGMMPLTGTTNRTHMDHDLAATALSLEPADVAMLEDVAA